MKALHRKRLAQAIAAATALGGATLLHAAFEEVTGSKNPFKAVTSGGDYPSIVMMDLDNDGDLDLVMFHRYTDDNYPFSDDFFSVWENIGDAEEASFAQVGDYNDGYGYGYGDGVNIDENPFVYTTNYGHPVTAFDISGDGTLDFLTGTLEGDYAAPRYFRVETEGGVVTGITRFDGGESSVDNPFYGTGQTLTPSALNYGYASSIAIGDLTNNGRPDLIVADAYTVRAFENVNTVDGRFQFTAMTSDLFPLELDSPIYLGAPMVLHDIDGDGDLDLIMGTSRAGNMRLFLNKGSAATPDFEEVTDEAGELDITTRGWAAPTFADITGNGIAELIVVERFETAPEDRPKDSSAPLFIVDLAIEQEIRLFARTPAEEEEEESETTAEEKKKKGKLFGGLGTGLLASFGLLLLRRRR